MKGSVILKLGMVTMAAASFMLLLLSNRDTTQLAGAVKPQPLSATAKQSGPSTDELAEPVNVALPTGIKGNGLDQIDWNEKLETLLKEPSIDPGEPALSDIFRLIAKDRFAEVIKLRSQLSNKTARKIITWKLYTHSRYDVSVDDIANFVDANPDWPSQGLLLEKAENKLFAENPESRRILEFFGKSAPTTPTGRIALARAYNASGQSDRVKQLVASVWREDRLSKKEEQTILHEFGHLLGSEDHHYRAHRILYDNTNDAVKRARTVVKLIEGTEHDKLNARIAMIQRKRKAKKLLSNLSPKERNDPDVVYTAVKWHQRSKQNSKALSLVKVANPVAESPAIADKWWKLRRQYIYDAINSGQPKTAYKIAKNYGAVTVNNLNQARFLSGWIALRFLKKPELALKHFTDLSESADGPRSRSRSQYWLGRTAAVMNQSEKANLHFKQGSEYFNTYYGQLSRQTLDPRSTSITIRQPPEPSPQIIRQFFSRDAVEAVIITHKNGLPGTTLKLLSRLRFRISNSQELRLLAELSEKIGRVQQTVRIGKRAMFYGYPFENYAYPIDALPEFAPIRPLPEPALIYAITRQESEFNPRIVSRAGARGLMQVMPATARHVSRQHNIKYELQKLLSDPAYNCRIASAYIADRMDEFGGSYIKAIAGFNAGPGRVRQWISKFGDPSRPEVDPVDWIERIPFTETRNYVQKVFANIQIYRARLGTPKSALMIRPDLHRGRS